MNVHVRQTDTNSEDRYSNRVREEESKSRKGYPNHVYNTTAINPKPAHLSAVTRSSPYPPQSTLQIAQWLPGRLGNSASTPGAGDRHSANNQTHIYM